MNPLWLILIIPVCTSVGVFAMALFVGRRGKHTEDDLMLLLEYREVTNDQSDLLKKYFTTLTEYRDTLVETIEKLKTEKAESARWKRLYMDIACKVKDDDEI